MSNLIPFNFNNHVVRCEIVDGEPWFVANDVCEILEYSNPRKALADHCKQKGVTKRYTLTDGGKQLVTYINEGNLYRLITKSKMPEAEKFEEKVFEEILPAIRKTGSYIAKQENTGLPQFRKARAIKSATDSAKEIFLTLPSLSEKSKQVIYANLINPIAGLQVIPLPTLDHRLYEAGEVGTMLNISANKVGRIANSLGIKTSEYGETVLGQSKYSSKQVPTFLYNEKGIEAIKNALVEITETTH